MKIAVVTPTTGRMEHLERCGSSVAESSPALKGHQLLHVVVWDGSLEKPSINDIGPVQEHHLVIPWTARNAGATPRAVGSIYARVRGADLIAFLDDDNQYHPNHLATAAELARHGVEVITSARMLCHYDTGEPMMVDQESDGVTFCDTNCMALAGNAMKFGATWDWPAPFESRCPSSGADRVFWERLKKSFGDAIVHTGAPTVMYRTPWLGVQVGESCRNLHYGKDVAPPDVAKVRVFKPGKQPTAIKVRPTQWIDAEERWGWEEIICDGFGEADKATHEETEQSKDMHIIGCFAEIPHKQKTDEEIGDEVAQGSDEVS